jgi:outer membrane protein
MIHRSIYCLILLLTTINCFSQTYNLQQCIDSAVANNILIRQSLLSARSAEINLQQSRADILPALNAEVYHGLNQGRSIDPSSNGYVNQQLGFANYQVAAGVTVFNGGTLRNNIKENISAHEASRVETQEQKDNLILNVILAYLRVLNNEEQLRAANNQAAASSREVERLNILNDKGAIKPSDLADMKGQYLNDQVAISNARNALESSKLLLAQLMNRPYDANMKLEKADASDFLTPYSETANSVYENALQQFASVRAAELRKKSSEYALRSLRGGFYPSVSIGGGFRSAYSSIAQNTAGKIPYNNQLKNNISSSLGVTVSIPLFNRFTVHNKVKQAEIKLQTNKLEEESTKLLLHQQIDQAYLDMNNAYEKYRLLTEQVQTYGESFHAAEARFQSGVGTSYDYLIAKDRLDRSNINLISAKYDFVLRKKVLDYYQGRK